MTNIEKWLMDKGFKLAYENVDQRSFNKIRTTRYELKYELNDGPSLRYEAFITVHKPRLNGEQDACTIKGADLLWFLITKGNSSAISPLDSYLRNEKRVEQYIEHLKSLAQSMDTVENPFNEVEEELE